MRFFLFAFLLYFLALTSFGQHSGEMTKTDYLAKSKKQKTAAWIFLGAGTASGIAGLASFNFAGSDNGSVNNTGATVLFVTGVTAVIASIPLFKASARNKKKAMNVSFHCQPAYQVSEGIFSYVPTPSIIVRWRI